MLRRLTDAVTRLRARLPWLDHLLRMLDHYTAVNGGGQAGAVTFFGFLSVFPILAIGFFVVGLVAHVYPDARTQLVQAIDEVLPGVIGTRDGKIDLSTISDSAAKVGVVGLLAVLYAGLGWLSGMRQSLEVMFAVPRRERPNFFVGKLRDLGALGLIGLTLLVSVALSGAVNGFSGAILDAVGIDPQATLPAVGLAVVGHLLAVAASTVLLMTMFVLLVGESGMPRRALLSGALLGALGFEVLKLAANLLLGQTRGQPAFQAFGVALILLVWINYFSRLVMYAAAWAYTAPAAVAARAAESVRAPGAVLAEARGPASPAAGSPAAEARAPASRQHPWRLGAAAAAGGAVVALLLRGTRGP